MSDGLELDPRHYKPLDAWADMPLHYVKARDTTIQLGWSETSRLETVVEFNTWKGQPSEAEEVMRTRYTLLLDTDLNVVCRIMGGAARGDESILDAMLRMSDVYAALPTGHGYGIVLSYDFFKREPYYKVTWAKRVAKQRVPTIE